MKQLIFLALCLTQLAAFSFKEAPAISKRHTPPTDGSQVYSYHAAIKEAVKGVVNISTTKKSQNAQSPLLMDPFFREFFGHGFGAVPRERQERSLGSGVVITANGYILTNNHVVQDATHITVTLPNDKKEYEAKLIGSDPKSDIAVVKIEAKNLPFLTVANSNELELGDLVFAIGNPFGIGETVTQGIISALDRSGVGINEYENFIQTDASINPGNSGGALIDSRGFLVGINTAIISRGGGNNGIGFAIPSSMFTHVAASLIEHGSVKRGLLGVSIEDISEKLFDFYKVRHGAVVTHVAPDSAAHKAGLKLGDLITHVNGQKVQGASDLKNLIGNLAPNSTVRLTILRNNQSFTLSATLDNAQSTQEVFGTLGLHLQELTPQLRNTYGVPSHLSGILIESVEPSSAADKTGLARGDVILQLESTPIENIEQFKKAWEHYKKLPKKRLFIYRNGYNHLAVIE